MNATRRQFLKTASTAAMVAAAPAVVTTKLFGQGAPSSLISVGIIGTGNIAEQHIETLLGYPEAVRILAVCDVDRDRREAALARIRSRSGRNDCVAYGDFRELNRRRDIDAVFVCTPDHWHALNAIDAVQNGKDVYVEKPMTLTIREGRALVAAARRHQRVVQHGTQHRSMKRFHDVAQFVRNQGLGKLERIDVAIPPNNRFCAASWSPAEPPPGLDWDMWLGPSPWRPYHPEGYHYNFRFIADHAHGQISNWGAHYLDIGQWALDADAGGPVEVEGLGQFPSSGLFSSATFIDFTCRYASGVPMRCLTRFEGGGTIRFTGERGWLDIARGRMSASSPDLLREMQKPGGPIQLALSNNHHENFLECIRTRARPIADVELGHRTTTVCNLGQIAITLGRRLRWDAAKEEFIGDDMANRLRGRALRSPWALT
jgi:predicted dehydrogenase